MKDAGYAAWSSQPQKAGPAAQAVADLVSQVRAASNWPPDAEKELTALGLWTEGIAQITASRMDEAAASLAKAGDLFGDLRQDAHAAQTQVPRIMALTLAGRHANAADCGERTQQEFLRLGDVHSAGKVSLNLGNLQLSRDDGQSAVRHYRRAAVLFARSGDVQHSVMADIGLGKALSAMGEMEEAVRIYARARMRATTHDLPVLRAFADEATAMLDLARGRFREALQGFERTRRNYEELAMPQNLAFAEVQLGEAYLEMRLLPEAVSLFKHALAAMQSLGMKDEQAWTQLQSARALAMLDRQDDAEPLLQVAASTFLAQDNQTGLASVRMALAELALAQHRNCAALELATEAMQLFEKQGQAEGRTRAETTVAHAQLGLGENALARQHLQNALQQAADLQLILVQVHCNTGLGLAALNEGHPADATRYFETAIALFDEQRRALPCDEMRSALLADHLRPYQELLRMAINQGAPDGKTVLRQLDRLRARALSERLLQGGAAIGDSGTRDLRVRLNWLYRNVHGRTEGGEPSAALAAEMRRTEHELLERARRERLLDGPLHAAGDSNAFEPDALCRRLAPDEALIEYGALGDELFACVARPDGVHLFRHLASWSSLKSDVRSARFQVDAMRYGEQALETHMPLLQRRVTSHLQRLHSALWQPLAAALDDVARVLVVPHGELGAVPFAALHDGHTCLGQQVCLAMAPSAQIALRMLAPWPGAPKHALALGDSNRLVHAAKEAQAVASLFPESEVSVDAQATIEALRTHGASADVIHLACHAEFRRDNPMFSALHLADGPLTAELVEGLQLPGAVVVLSACETGLAGHPSGDELVGLVRAFLIAGASRVVATLWPIDDAVTLDFMRHFYQALRDGLTPSASLQVAQELTRNRLNHPFYWAPFVLHGGW